MSVTLLLAAVFATVVAAVVALCVAAIFAVVLIACAALGVPGWFRSTRDGVEGGVGRRPEPPPEK